jgi:hypothetical protein
MIVVIGFLHLPFAHDREAIIAPHRAKQPEVTVGAFDRAADWRRASELALFEILNRLLNVADALLHLARNLFRKPLDLLFLASNQLACLFLDFAGNVLRHALHLVFVHVQLLLL